MEKLVFVWKLFSNKPETKNLCLFEVTSCDKQFAQKEIQDFCINHTLTTDDYFVKKYLK